MQKYYGKLLLIGLGVIIILGSTVAAAVTSPQVSDVTATNESAADVNYSQIAVGVQGAPKGRVVMVNRSNDIVWSRANVTSYHDVTILNETHLLAAYVVKSSDCGRFDSPCGRTGYRVFDWQNDTIVSEYSFPVRSQGDSEVHDVEVLSDGSYVVADMEYERIFGLSPNGTTTWQWNASSFYDAPADPTKEDWLHINDVDRIGPGRYLVSVRNANQLLIIERNGSGASVAEVINADENPNDNVRRGNESLLDRQHNPHWLGDGAVLVADSENNRIVELHRNESTGEWSPAWILNSASGLEFDWPRDADRLPNGNTLITDSRNNRIVEVTSNGTVLRSVRVESLPYEADVRAGESANVSRYPLNGSTNEGPSADAPTQSVTSMQIPLVHTLYAGIVHTVSVPYWFSQWLVLGYLIGAVPILAGLIGIVGAKFRS